MHTRRRFLGAAALGLFGGALPFTVRAQGVDTAKIIIGFPPGGTTDVMGRKVAEKLRGGYARVCIVENRPGAGGQLGVVALKDSPADGSAMLLTPSSMLTIYPHIYKNLQYKLEDVAPVSLAMYTHHVLSVGPAVPDSVKTIKEFFAWTKANPDKASYGSPGAGSMPHLIGVLLNKAGGADLRHIAYRGSAPGIQELLGGQISSFLGPVGDVLTHSKAGKVRVLGSSGAQRDDVPARRADHARAGLQHRAARVVRVLHAGAHQRRDAVQRASAALQQAIAQPDVADFGKQFGLAVQSSPPRAARRPAEGGCRRVERPRQGDRASPPTREPAAGGAPDAQRPAGQPVGGRRAPRRTAASCCARRTRCPRTRASSPSGSTTGPRARPTACSSRSAGRTAPGSTSPTRRRAAARGASRRRCIERRLSAERPVAVLSGNDFEHALIELGALYAGVPYAPVSPAYSLLSKDFAKLKHVMRPADARAGLRIAERAASRRRSRRGIRRSRWSTATTSTSSKPEATGAVDEAHARVGPDTIAKFLFTSGSTGEPKAVINTQRMWCSNQAMIRYDVRVLRGRAAGDRRLGAVAPHRGGQPRLRPGALQRRLVLHRRGQAAAGRDRDHGAQPARDRADLVLQRAARATRRCCPILRKDPSCGRTSSAA